MEEKIVIFSEHSSILRLCQKIITKKLSIPKEVFVTLIGEDKSSNFSIALVGRRAAGAGIDLLGARFMIHLDVGWDSCSFFQSVYRCYRKGQTRNEFSFVLLSGQLGDDNQKNGYQVAKG